MCSPARCVRRPFPGDRLRGGRSPLPKPPGMVPHGVEHPIGIVWCNECDGLPSFATPSGSRPSRPRAARTSGNGQRRFVQPDSDTSRVGDLVQRRCSATLVGSRIMWMSAPVSIIAVTRSWVARYRWRRLFEPQSLPAAHHCDAVRADVAADDDDIAGTTRCGRISARLSTGRCPWC